jgi:hypothetical protein
MLDVDIFLDVVARTPLVAVDLVLVRGGSEVLLGLRNNRPAQGFWFVPGGRIRKNEPLHTALVALGASAGFTCGSSFYQRLSGGFFTLQRVVFNPCASNDE